MNPKAEIRADLIRRLFAVAISVGFATTLSKMDWVEKNSLPVWHEWEQLAILATGLILTVTSWDGYFASIAAKPLNDPWRFWIDIFLVFIYMFFLISSKQANFWLPILVIVFGLYFIGDVLTIREHMSSYDISLVPPGSDDSYRAKFSDVVRVYRRGFLNKPDTKRGPIITLSWAIFFVVLAVLNYRATAHLQVFIACVFAIVGLFLYRHDKNVKTGTNVTGHGMVFRVILIGALLGVAALFLFGVIVSL